MDKASLLVKVAKLLGVSSTERELAFQTLVEKIGGMLETDEALKIPELGYFQIKRKPTKLVEKILEDDLGTVASDTLLFSPISDSLDLENRLMFLTFDIPSQKNSDGKLDESIFDIGFGKPILPLSSETPNSDSETAYLLLKKSIEERVLELLANADKLQNFDLWEDYLSTLDTDQRESQDDGDFLDSLSEPDEIDKPFEEDKLIIEPVITPITEPDNSENEKEEAEMEIKEDDDDLLNFLKEEVDQNEAEPEIQDDIDSIIPEITLGRNVDQEEETLAIEEENNPGLDEDENVEEKIDLELGSDDKDEEFVDEVVTDEDDIQGITEEPEEKEVYSQDEGFDEKVSDIDLDNIDFSDLDDTFSSDEEVNFRRSSTSELKDEDNILEENSKEPEENNIVDDIENEDAKELPAELEEFTDIKDEKDFEFENSIPHNEQALDELKDDEFDIEREDFNKFVADLSLESDEKNKVEEEDILDILDDVPQMEIVEKESEEQTEEEIIPDINIDEDKKQDEIISGFKTFVEEDMLEEKSLQVSNEDKGDSDLSNFPKEENPLTKSEERMSDENKDTNSEWDFEEVNEDDIEKKEETVEEDDSDLFKKLEESLAGTEKVEEEPVNEVDFSDISRTSVTEETEEKIVEDESSIKLDRSSVAEDKGESKRVRKSYSDIKKKDNNMAKGIFGVVGAIVIIAFVVVYFFTGDAPKSSEEALKIDSSAQANSATSETGNDDLISVQKDDNIVDGENKTETREPAKTPTVKQTNTSDGLLKSFSQETMVGNLIFYNGSDYYFQVSSHPTYEKATVAANALIKKGYDAFIMKAWINKYNSYWYRVKVGYFKTETEARNFQRNNKF